MPCLIPFFNPALASKVDVLVIGKERWFRASDIAKNLGYSDADSATYKWKEEVCVFAQKDLPGVNLGARMVRFITSDGLLALLISSSRPMAQLLRKWIVGDVLPSLDSLAFDTDTGQSAFDKSITKEFEALKKANKTIRKQHDEQMVAMMQRVACTIASWAESAPLRHVNLFLEAMESISSVGNTKSTF